MTLSKLIAIVLMLMVFAAAMLAGWLAPAGFEQQFRAHPNESPSSRFLLGTDELGRDRLARLLYGSRVSLLLAPAVAALATSIALGIALVAGFAGGKLDKSILAATDLTNSVPLLFVLIGARALLPLDMGTNLSIAITFSLLALCGWASGVRVLRSAVLQVKNSGYIRQAVAAGGTRHRTLFLHSAAALRPVLTAQFFLMTPQFLIAEANLGALGLGISEPVPSWGNLLMELQNYITIFDAPWRLAPALLLAITLLSFQILLAKRQAVKS